MSNYYWLNNPIHENMIKFEMTDEFKDKIKISFDGTIVAVKESCFDLSEDKDAVLYSMGYKKKEEEKKKRRGVFYNFIDSEDEFSKRVKEDRNQ